VSTNKKKVTPEVQPPEATGGGGYDFEDSVTAWYLKHLLLGEPALHYHLGPPTRVQMQTAVDGWPFDDLLVTFAGPPPARAMASIKSNRREVVTRHGFNREVVRDCWTAYRGTAPSAFDPAVDLAVMVTEPLARTVSDAVEGVVQRAIASPAELWGRAMKKSRWCNKIQRALIESFACPENLRGPADPAPEVGKLLRSVRVQELDFGAVDSRLEAQAILDLQRTCGLEPPEAIQLWVALRDIARRYRSRSGSLTREELLAELRRTLPTSIGGKLDRQETEEQVGATYRPDELPDAPRAEDLASSDEVLELAYEGVPDGEYPDDRDVRVAAAVRRVQERLATDWRRLEATDAAEPPWDGLLEMYVRATEEAELDIVFRNTSKDAAVVQELSITVLRDYWPIAGLLEPALRLRILVDDLHITEARREPLATPLEVLPGRAERLVVATESGKALFMRVRAYYNGVHSIAKNAAFFDAPEAFED
jgi:hypothetical protein